MRRLDSTREKLEKIIIEGKNQAKIADRCVNILAKWDYNIVVG